MGNLLGNQVMTVKDATGCARLERHGDGWKEEGWGMRRHSEARVGQAALGVGTETEGLRFKRDRATMVSVIHFW